MTMKQTRILAFLACMAFLAACGTHNKALKHASTPPEGITFTRIENFKGFSVIQLPYAGFGFDKNMDVNVRKNQTDAGVFVPGVRFYNNTLILKSDVGKAESSLDDYCELVKKMYLNHLIKSTSELEVQKIQLDGLEVAQIRLVTPVNKDLVKYSFGYILPHHNKAALFFINDALVSPLEVADYNTRLEQAFRYMIHTADFQDI